MYQLPIDPQVITLAQNSLENIRNMNAAISSPQDADRCLDAVQSTTSCRTPKLLAPLRGLGPVIPFIDPGVNLMAITPVTFLSGFRLVGVKPQQ